MTTLYIRTITPHSLHAPLVLPFRLTTLTLATPSVSFSVLSALFSSSAQTLRTLHVQRYGYSMGTFDSAFLSAFPLVAASLTELHLPPKTNEAFLPLLRGCKALHTLITEEVRQYLLSKTLLALPTATVRSLFVNILPSRERGFMMDVEIAPCLERCLAFPGLSAIERIQVRGNMGFGQRGGVRKGVEGERLAEVCDRRGIVLI